jgi:hypothetical protein
MEIIKRILSIKFVNCPYTTRLLNFEIPEDQPFINLEFNSEYVMVELEKNLGVSIQEIFNSKFEFVDL